jgi:hypothetical protein
MDRRHKVRWVGREDRAGRAVLGKAREARRLRNRRSRPVMAAGVAMAATTRREEGQAVRAVNRVGRLRSIELCLRCAGLYERGRLFFVCADRPVPPLNHSGRLPRNGVGLDLPSPAPRPSADMAALRRIQLPERAADRCRHIARISPARAAQRQPRNRPLPAAHPLEHPHGQFGKKRISVRM